MLNDSFGIVVTVVYSDSLNFQVILLAVVTVQQELMWSSCGVDE